MPADLTDDLNLALGRRVKEPVILPPKFKMVAGPFGTPTATTGGSGSGSSGSSGVASGSGGAGGGAEPSKKKGKQAASPKVKNEERRFSMAHEGRQLPLCSS